MLKRDIVLDDAGNVFIVDFGLARINHEVTRTRTGMATGGRFRFMAPELYSALLHDGDFRTSYASDCYAFGMTMLQMMTLQHPYPDKHTEDGAASLALKGILPPRPSDFENMMPNIFEVWWELLQTMWQYQPKERPRLDAVLVALEGISSLMSATPITSSDGSVENSDVKVWF